MKFKSGLRDKKLIVFDMDGTLTPTKSPIKKDMVRLLCGLLGEKAIAVIGGGKHEQFKKQFLANFSCPREMLKNLFLFPTTATSFYKYDGGWKKVYKFELSARERVAIKGAFRDVLKEIHYIPPKKVYGKVLEDRRTQVTFSALGQEVVSMLGEKRGVRMKTAWKENNTPLKLKIAAMVQKRLPNLEVHAAGFTSIDVTKKGIDKAYGIRQIEKVLKVRRKDMLFVGDAIFPGGNDYAVVKTGVDHIQVSGPEECKKVIKFVLGGF